MYFIKRPNKPGKKKRSAMPLFVQYKINQDEKKIQNTKLIYLKMTKKSITCSDASRTRQVLEFVRVQFKDSYVERDGCTTFWATLLYILFYFIYFLFFWTCEQNSLNIVEVINLVHIVNCHMTHIRRNLGTHHSFTLFLNCPLHLLQHYLSKTNEKKEKNSKQNNLLTFKLIVFQLLQSNI